MNKRTDFTAPLYPLASLTVLVLLWQGAITLFHIPDYLLPPPAAVFRALYDGFATGLLWPHIGATLAETVSGYLIGCSLALIFGAALA